MVNWGVRQNFQKSEKLANSPQLPSNVRAQNQGFFMLSETDFRKCCITKDLGTEDDFIWEKRRKHLGVKKWTPKKFQEHLTQCISGLFSFLSMHKSDTQKNQCLIKSKRVKYIENKC